MAKKNPLLETQSASNDLTEISFTNTDEVGLSPKQRMVESKLEGAKVSRPLVYQRLFEGLQAVKRGIEIEDGCQVEVAEPDMAMRHKYMETALRVYGDLKEGMNVGVGVNVKVSKQESELLEAYRRS